MYCLRPIGLRWLAWVLCELETSLKWVTRCIVGLRVYIICFQHYVVLVIIRLVDSYCSRMFSHSYLILVDKFPLNDAVVMIVPLSNSIFFLRIHSKIHWSHQNAYSECRHEV